VNREETFIRKSRGEREKVDIDDVESLKLHESSAGARAGTSINKHITLPVTVPRLTSPRLSSPPHVSDFTPTSR
jgi:hypothetical protein